MVVRVGVGTFVMLEGVGSRGHLARGERRGGGRKGVVLVGEGDKEFTSMRV